MRPSSRESEIKLRFPSAADALESIRRLGARLVRKRQFEDNVLYDRAGSPLAAAGCLLRLRRYGPDAFLTYKAPVPDETAHKVRVEYETPVTDPDATRRILEALGYEPTYRYQKYRTVFRLDGLEITVDETPIGCWVEIEGPPDAIDSAAAAMGFARDAYIRDTYLDLHRRHAEARGEAAGDLVFTGTGGQPVE